MGIEYPNMSAREIAEVKRELDLMRRKEQLGSCLSADNLKSRPTEGQLEVLKAAASSKKFKFCLGGNQSGKTSLLLRDLSWVLDDHHKFWMRPNDTHCNNKLCMSEDLYTTGDESVPIYHCKYCGNIWRAWNKDVPINLILSGENRTNLTENLYANRLRPLLLTPDAWKPAKMGNQILWLENQDNGNKLFLFPHGHGSEQARKAIQGWSINGVYLDELCPLPVFEELARRRDALMGSILTSFTMKTLDPSMVRHMRELEAAGVAISFKISKLDNPVYSGDKDRVLAELSGLTEDQRNTILYGDISTDGDDRIFAPCADSLKIPALPSTYSTTWRHVEIVDPAIKSKAGYLLMAQDPHTLIWHTVKAKYITGMVDATDLVHACEREGYNYNICLRGSDNMAYFIGAARKMGIRYKTPPNKQSKMGGKIALIKQAQTFLNGGRVKIHTEHKDLWDEIYGYRWKEGSADSIVNSAKYHIIDCLMYFIDLLPKDELIHMDSQISWSEEIRRYNIAIQNKKTQAGGNGKQVLTKRSGTGIIKSVTGKSANNFYKRLGLGGKIK